MNAHTHKAWTGGSSPGKFLAVSWQERNYVRHLFREQVTIWQTYWNEYPPKDVRRTFWARARFDAHATFS